MCGIFGFVGFNDSKLLRVMSKAMLHRGPDQQGFFYKNGLGLGMNRLSIIDTSKIELPIANEDKSLLLVFNGEIYNYKEIRKELLNKGHRFATRTDAEVLVHLYEERSYEMLDMLNGMFAFAILDLKQGKLFLARDRLGIKPLFYYYEQGKLLFASEINGLLATKLVKPKPNLESIDRFITFRYNSSQQTLFEGINRLEPATYGVFKDDNLELRKYWRIKPKPPQKALKELNLLLKDSIKLRLQSDVKVGIFLSGGLDSSTVAYYVSRLGCMLTSFSMNFKENKKAELMVGKLGLKHHSFKLSSSCLQLLPKLIKHLGEPLADPIIIPTYLLAKEAKKYCTVLLTGEGADEIFGGYEQYKIMLLFWYHKQHTPKFIQSSLQTLLNLPFMPKNLADFHRQQDAGLAYTTLISCFSESERGELYSMPLKSKLKPNFLLDESLLYNMQFYDVQHFLTADNLYRLDMMLMAHSMEGRVPFLDHRIVELAFGLPDEMRRNKAILRKLMQGRLPSRIVNAKKERWILPTDKIFPYDEFKKLYSNKELQKYFNMQHIVKLLNYKQSFQHKLFSFNRLTRLYYSRQLWNLLCFGLWYKQFIK